MSIDAIIRHSDESKVESFPGLVRVITPHYLSFTADDLVSSNYTVASGEQVTAKALDDTESAVFHANAFDLNFPRGITFDDVINVTFTMTVDPNELLEKGSGVDTPNVVLSPVCHQWVRSNYPVVDPVDPPAYQFRTQCGDPVSVKVAIETAECYETIPITIDDADCVRASSHRAAREPIAAFLGSGGGKNSLKNLSCGHVSITI